MPLSFEVNRGQTDSRAKFLAKGRDVGLFFTDDGAVLALSKPVHHDDHRPPGAQLRQDAALPQTRQSLALRYRFADANRHPKIEALDPLPGHSNYFIGNDPKRWRTDITQYRRVRYHDVYPGVDVVYYGKDGQLEFDIEAAPGTDVSRMRLCVEGADSLALDGDGNLKLHTALGVLTQSKPLVYQMIDGERRELKGEYELRDIRRDLSAHEIAFRVADYDQRYALVLDPSLVFAKLIGGTGTDDGLGVAIDSANNSYVTGYTNSTGFPTTVGAYQTPGRAGYDTFITKISADGTTLIYSALIGGSSSDFAYGIGVDSTGQAYITGYTVSSNFPTLNALQSTNPGVQSGFVTALNAAGSALIYSTYLGGNNGATINEAIAVDPAGNAYVTGLIYGPGLPVSAGSFQATNGGGEDAFVFKFDPAGARVYGTYLGGAGGEEGRAIAVDSEGDAYVAGGTNSASFNGVTLTTIGPLGGTFAMLIAEINPSGSGLVYATKIGGSQQDEAIGIAVDSGHQVYFTAFSNSPDLPPTTPPQHTGVFEAYIGHLDDSGSVLYDFTWYGATDGSQDYGVAVDLDETRQSLYAIGYAQPLSSMPVLNPVTGLDCGGSCAVTTGAFLLQYTLNPLTLASATRVAGGSGSSNTDFSAVAHDPTSGDTVATGSSDGTPPTTTNAGGKDALEVRVDNVGGPPRVYPPVISKYFDPPIAKAGQEVSLTFIVTNPNKSNLPFGEIFDALPSCVSNDYSSDPVIDPPGCLNLSFQKTPSIFGPFWKYVISGSPPARTVCSITVKLHVEWTAANCPNEGTVGDGFGGYILSGSKFKANLFSSTYYRDQWASTATNVVNPGSGSPSETTTYTKYMSAGSNWLGGMAPPTGYDLLFPLVGSATPLVFNDLPTTQTFNIVAVTGTGYTFSGGTFNLLAGINNTGVSNTFSAQINASLPIGITSDPVSATLILSGGINLNGQRVDFQGAGSTAVASQISGTGNVGVGFGMVTLSVNPTFTGNLNIGGGTLIVDASVSEPLHVLNTGVLRGTGTLGAVTVDDSGSVFPGDSTIPVTQSATSLTVNSGFVELEFSANNSTHSSLNASGAVQLNGGTLKLDLATQPIVGTTFTNLITAPGTISGCLGQATATPSNVFVKPQCTASAVSAIVVAVDGIFRNGFN